MSSYIKVLPLLPLLVIWGCDGDSHSQQIDVNEDVVLNLLPALSPFGYGLNFSFQSDSVYHCKNVGFVYTLNSSLDDINIHLLGVNLPETCISGTAPAFEKVKVPGDDGLYSIVIDIGDYIHNRGTLVIENNSYSIYMNSQDGMALPESKMIRIPAGTVWGYVLAPNSNQQNDVMILVHNALESITENADLDEGYYGYFSVSNILGVYTEYPYYHIPQACFVYHFSQDKSSLENTIQQIRAQLPQGTEFKVYTWEGFEL